MGKIELECICDEINSRHCQYHQELADLQAAYAEAVKMLEEMAGALDAMIKSCDKHNCGLKIADAILDKYKRWKAGE